MEKVLMKAGYYISVESWENDGDFNRNISNKLDKDIAKSLIKLSEGLFKDGCNDDINIGNLYDTNESNYRILQYIISNPSFLKDLDLGDITVNQFEENIKKFFKGEAGFKNNEWNNWIGDYIEENPNTPLPWVDKIKEYNYKLLGRTEEYESFRVYESAEITYTPIDLIVKVII